MTEAEEAEHTCQQRLADVEERLAEVEEQARETRRQLAALARRVRGEADAG